jgi:UDPglucose 6-dehydrogenase/GDP-mannose 6-dehydrogenase
VLPIHEAGLPELLTLHLGERFFPTSDLATAVRESDLTLIAVGTPLDNGSISLRFIREAAAAIGAVLATKDAYHVVVVKSTVVPGTTDDVVRPVVEETSGKRCGQDFGLGTNPEFLREGEAVDDFQHPDRIVLGATDDRAMARMIELYAEFQGVEQVLTNPRTAEMIKYASNALLATLISFSNEIGNLCSESAGIDVLDVLGAVHLDRRISPIAADGTRTVPQITSYLRAGCGFGGSCFPKDVRALISWGDQNNRPAKLLATVLEMNEQQPQEILKLLKRHFPVLRGVRVAVLGLAFKAGTDDIRESPALRVIRDLAAEGACVVAHDPVAIPPARLVLGNHSINYAPVLTDALLGADAVVVLTAWPEFKALPDLLRALEHPPLVVDGRRMFDKTRTPRYEGIGLRAEQVAS